MKNFARRRLELWQDAVKRNGYGCSFINIDDDCVRVVLSSLPSSTPLESNEVMQNHLSDLIVFRLQQLEDLGVRYGVHRRAEDRAKGSLTVFHAYNVPC